jgi:hypothetical protein
LCILIGGEVNKGKIMLKKLRHKELLDYFELLGKGQLVHKSIVYKFGRNSAATNNTAVWDGETNYTFLTQASKLKIKSVSPDDTNITGSGAHTVRIYGCDAQYNPIYEDVELNGITDVLTNKSFLRTFRGKIINGADHTVFGSNHGDITMTSVDGNILQAKILTGKGQTLMAIYTIPAGYTGLIWQASGGVGKGKACTTELRVREYGGVFQVKGIRDHYQNSFQQSYKAPTKVNEKSDIVFTTGVSASFMVELIKNEEYYYEYGFS